MKGWHWTTRDAQIVREIFASGVRDPAKAASKLIGRSREAIKAYASRHGIRRAKRAG